MCVCTVEDGKVRRCSLHDAAEDYLERLLATEKAIARLQERVEEAEHRLTEANEAQREIEGACLRAQKERDNARSHAKRLNTLHNAEKAKRDGYKALAERRKGAIKELLIAVEQLGVFPDGIVARDARTTITMTPAEALEERR